LTTNQGFKNIIIKDKSKVNVVYLAYIVKTLTSEMESLVSGGTFKEISKTSFSSLKIPLPPMEVQEKIVEKIEKQRKIIEGCRELIKIYDEKIKKVINKVWGEE